MDLELLIQQFSSPRLEPYVAAAGTNPTLAAELYDWNIRISGAWLEDLSIVEVLLRNAFDRALREEHGQAWYDESGVLLNAQWPVVDDAKAKIRARTEFMDKDDEPATDQVVAELPFGFWRSILGRGYQTDLWPVLRQVFVHVQPPTAKVHQDVVEGRVSDLVDLRNEIAHHWPIFGWDMERSIQNVKQITGPISPAVQAWLVQRSRVPALVNANPLRAG